MIRQWIGIGVAAIAVPYVLRQVRKPDRWFGRLFAWSMNRSHSGLTGWGLAHVTIGSGFTILDVGCGGGATVRKLAAVASQGHVTGVDYAAGSVATSRATNAPLIRAGRVEICQGSVSELPFPDQSFDLVTAVETHYYWPDLAGDLQQVFRVLKPGGMAIVIAEAYRGSTTSVVMAPAMALIGGRLMTAEQHREWFAGAGFTDVQVFEEPGHGWLSVTGRKPA
jgi:SAM-dependent methyltransferase